MHRHRPTKIFVWPTYKSTPQLSGENLSKIFRPIREYIRYYNKTKHKITSDRCTKLQQKVVRKRQKAAVITTMKQSTIYTLSLLVVTYRSFNYATSLQVLKQVNVNNAE